LIGALPGDAMLAWRRSLTEFLFETAMTISSARESVIKSPERLAQEQEERAEKRRLELAEQRSDLNPPEVRIRTWERIHGLRLPSDPEHPIVDVIAIGTRLTIEEVRNEQQMRTARVRSAGQD
jgi:hypothetical protein